MEESTLEVGEEITWLGRSVRGILLDMDGTLAHTREAHADVWVEWAREHGFDVTREQYLAEMYGRSNYDVMSELLPELIGRQAEVLAMADQKEAIFRHMASQGRVPAVAGAGEFIRRAARAGLPVAVASAAPRENVDVVLEMLGVGHLIDVRVGEQDVERTKPEPDAYLLAAKRLGIAPEECVVFEDSRFGLAAGRAAGCRTVAILSQHTAEEMAPLSDLAVLDFEKLMASPPWSQLL